MSKIKFEDWLDDSGIKFRTDIPANKKGAIDLLNYKLQKNSLQPTFEDVQDMDNQDFDIIALNCNKAYKYFKQALNVSTPREHVAQVHAAQSKKDKREIKREHKTK